MRIQENNFAFIDGQNLHMGMKELGWRLSYEKFRRYLKDKYSVQRAYIFIGYVAKYKKFYDSFGKAGYEIIFKRTIPDELGNVKGNVDADLVLHSMIKYPLYDKAVIISSDGDFYSLVNYLYDNNKLKIVVSSRLEKCSTLLKKAAREKIVYINNLQSKLEHIAKKHR